ncbi:MAG: L,D-transpeptidase family protein [Alphaproteobacteria bacterium]|nr:L,D-transpeptidase family protein [Alphaproteobacteria bacterium]
MCISVEAKAGETKGLLRFEDLVFPCALGRSGITEAKREGDGGTPPGRYPLRSLFYRPDRAPPPPGRLHPIPLQRDYGWGDDCNHPETYNRLILLPAASGHEVLWREDEIYDLILVIGYNDAPPIPGRGSAIFLHLARPGLTPTEGCVALARSDLLALLDRIGPETPMEIREIP